MRTVKQRNKGFTPEKKTTKAGFLERLENIDFWNGKHELGIHAARLLLGKGIQFTADNEKLEDFINKVFDYNNIAEFLFTATYWMSRKGRVIATVSKQGDKYFLDIAKPQWYNRVAKVRIKPELAVIYKTIIISDKTFTIREKWDKEKVVRELNGVGDEITLEGLNEQLAPEDQIKEVETHNLGFVPVFEMLNNPISGTTLTPNATGDYAYEMLADAYPVRQMEELINHVYRTLAEETILNQSKVIGYYDNQNISKLSSESSRLKYLTKRLFFNVKSPGGDGREPSFEKIQPVSGYIKELTETAKMLKGQYYDGAGYSTQDDAAIDTATQTLYAKSKDVATTKLKRDNLTEIMLRIIDCILIYADQWQTDNQDNRPYSFEIRENLNISEVETVNNEIIKLDAGLETLAEAIANIRGISEQEAEAIAKKIKEEQAKKEAEALTQMAQFEAAQNTQPGNNSNQEPPQNQPNRERNENATT